MENVLTHGNNYFEETSEIQFSMETGISSINRNNFDFSTNSLSTVFSNQRYECNSDEWHEKNTERDNELIEFVGR